MQSASFIEEVVRSSPVVHLARTRYREPWFGRRRPADPVRVFVIDSDVSRSAQLVVQLHAIGSYVTRSTSTCDSALRIADEFLPNIVLLNIDFPELASFRLAASLRWRFTPLGVRLIALTSDLAAADRLRALDAGFEQYLTIPAQYATLERVLRPALRRGNSLTCAGLNHRRS